MIKAPTLLDRIWRMKMNKSNARSRPLHRIDKVSMLDARASICLVLGLRPRSHGNAIVPFHHRSSFWNAKIDCSHGNGTIAYRFLFLFTRERNRSVPQFFLQSLPFFSVTTTSTHALWDTNLIVPFFGPVLTSLPVHTGTERNDCVSFHFSYHFFHRSTFWNGTMLFQVFPCERNP